MKRRLLLRLPAFWRKTSAQYRKRSGLMLSTSELADRVSITTVAGIATTVRKPESVATVFHLRSIKFAAAVSYANCIVLTLRKKFESVIQNRLMSVTVAVNVRTVRLRKKYISVTMHMRRTVRFCVNRAKDSLIQKKNFCGLTG